MTLLRLMRLLPVAMLVCGLVCGTALFFTAGAKVALKWMDTKVYGTVEK